MTKKFSKTEKNKISSFLQKRLSPEFLSVRPGFGSSKLTYVEGWLLIRMANFIFGYDGWSSEIKSMTTDFYDNENGRVSIGVSCCCRVTLKDGSYREDIGFGNCDNQRSKSMAFEKAKKEACTDSLKRALRQFGEALGNCLYDKEFLSDVHNVKKSKKLPIKVSKLIYKSNLEVDSSDYEDYTIFSGDN